MPLPNTHINNHLIRVINKSDNETQLSTSVLELLDIDPLILEDKDSWRQIVRELKLKIISENLSDE